MEKAGNDITISSKLRRRDSVDGLLERRELTVSKLPRILSLGSAEGRTSS